MKKKYYTVFFASQQDQFTRSVQFSRSKGMLILFFGLILISFAVIGGLGILDFAKMGKKISNLNNDRMLLNNIISDFNYAMNTDSTLDYEYFITKFYTQNSLEYPEIAPVRGYVTKGIQIENNHLGIRNKKYDVPM